MVSAAVYIVDFMGRSLTLLESTTPGSWAFSTEEKRPFSLSIVNGVAIFSIQLVDGPFLSFSTSDETIGTSETALDSSSTLEAYADLEKRYVLRTPQGQYLQSTKDANLILSKTPLRKDRSSKRFFIIPATTPSWMTAYSTTNNNNNNNNNSSSSSTNTVTLPLSINLKASSSYHHQHKGWSYVSTAFDRLTAGTPVPCCSEELILDFPLLASDLGHSRNNSGDREEGKGTRNEAQKTAIRTRNNSKMIECSNIRLWTSNAQKLASIDPLTNQCLLIDQHKCTGNERMKLVFHKQTMNRNQFGLLMDTTDNGVDGPLVVGKMTGSGGGGGFDSKYNKTSGSGIASCIVATTTTAATTTPNNIKPPNPSSYSSSSSSFAFNLTDGRKIIIITAHATAIGIVPTFADDRPHCLVPTTEKPPFSAPFLPSYIFSTGLTTTTNHNSTTRTIGTACCWTVHHHGDDLYSLTNVATGHPLYVDRCGLVCCDGNPRVKFPHESVLFKIMTCSSSTGRKNSNKNIDVLGFRLQTYSKIGGRYLVLSAQPGGLLSAVDVKSRYLSCWEQFTIIDYQTALASPIKPLESILQFADNLYHTNDDGGGGGGSRERNSSDNNNNNNNNNNGDDTKKRDTAAHHPGGGGGGLKKKINRLPMRRCDSMIALTTAASVSSPLGSPMMVGQEIPCTEAKANAITSSLTRALQNQDHCSGTFTTTLALPAATSLSPNSPPSSPFPTTTNNNNNNNNNNNSTAVPPFSSSLSPSAIGMRRGRLSSSSSSLKVGSAPTSSLLLPHIMEDSVPDNDHFLLITPSPSMNTLLCGNGEEDSESSCCYYESGEEEDREGEEEDGGDGDASSSSSLSSSSPLSSSYKETESNAAAGALIRTPLLDRKGGLSLSRRKWQSESSLSALQAAVDGTTTNTPRFKWLAALRNQQPTNPSGWGVCSPAPLQELALQQACGLFLSPSGEWNFLHDEEEEFRVVGAAAVTRLDNKRNGRSKKITTMLIPDAAKKILLEKDFPDEVVNQVYNRLMQLVAAPVSSKISLVTLLSKEGGENFNWAEQYLSSSISLDVINPGDEPNNNNNNNNNVSLEEVLAEVCIQCCGGSGRLLPLVSSVHPRHHGFLSQQNRMRFGARGGGEGHGGGLGDPIVAGLRLVKMMGTFYGIARCISVFARSGGRGGG